jgi:hypothetical protein
MTCHKPAIVLGPWVRGGMQCATDVTQNVKLNPGQTTTGRAAAREQRSTRARGSRYILAAYCGRWSNTEVYQTIGLGKFESREVVHVGIAESETRWSRIGGTRSGWPEQGMRT